MKKVFLLLIATIAFSTTQAQEVSDKQWSMLIKKTATWCSKCGGYGWTFFKSAQERFGAENLIMMAAHSGGNLKTDVSAAVSNVVPASSQPKFILDQGLLSVTSSNIPSQLDIVKSTIDFNKGQKAVIGIGSLVTRSEDGTITARSKAKMFQDHTKTDYSIAHYLVRKKKIASQSGQGANAQHTNVLETSISGENFGTDVRFEATSAGTEVDVVVSKKLDINPEDYIVYTVLWIKDNGKYTFYNATKSDITITSSTDDLEEEKDAVEIITITKDRMSLKVEDTSVPQIGLRMVSNNGSLVLSTEIETGINQEIAYPTIASGIYHIVITAGKKTITKSVLVSE